MTNRDIFYGDNLRLARLNIGISLNDLGERVKASRQYIHQLETTDKTPSPDLLDALAFELKVSPSFFKQPISNDIKEEECHFRKLKTVPTSTVRECTARITLTNILISLLESRINFPEVNFPSMEEARDASSIEKAAYETRKMWGLGDGPIGSVIRALENAGAVILTFGEISEKVDALSVFRGRPLIIFNSSKSSCRIRFDLAHEAAHLILHQGLETGDYNTEAEADLFASSFLLPIDSLCKEYPHRTSNKIDWNAITKIKIKWGISSRAIIFKLNQYGIITPSQFRSANITLTKTGQTKSEYYDDKVRIEHPEVLPSAISLLGNTYGPGFGGVLNEMGITNHLLGTLTNCDDIVKRISESNEFPTKVRHISEYR